MFVPRMPQTMAYNPDMLSSPTGRMSGTPPPPTHTPQAPELGFGACLGALELISL